MTTEEVENEVKEVAVKATKALSNATYTKEEALALEKEIRDAVNRTRGKIVSTVKFRLTDTHFTVADADLQIRGAGRSSTPWDKGGGGGLQKIFSALQASFWSKNKGGRPPQAPPLDPPLFNTDASLLWTVCFTPGEGKRWHFL